VFKAVTENIVRFMPIILIYKIKDRYNSIKSSTEDTTYAANRGNRSQIAQPSIKFNVHLHDSTHSLYTFK
jgi:hypothetical protein